MSTVAEVIGAAGVIVTLVYLAIQVHRNTRQLQFQGMEAARKEFLNVFDELTRTRENADLFRHGLNQFSQMSANDQACFHSQMHALLHGYHSVWSLNNAGILTNRDFEGMRQLLASVLITPGGRQWWETFRHIPPPYLIAHMQEAIDNETDPAVPITESLPWLKIENDS